MLRVSEPCLEGNELKYVTDAIQTGWLTHHGSYERRFEKEFEGFCGRPALATSSGTGALHLALLTLGIKAGDEVIVPALSFGATASVVLAVGAKPVFVDVDDKACIDARLIPDAVTSKTKAIIPVHLYGERADMEAVKRMAVMYDLKVIEDACEALGLVKPSADLACFSFYANKIITTGEGGMLVGDLGRAEEWRNGGFDADYRHEIPGLNYRMTNLQAALGCAQLERISELLYRRLKCVEFYKRHLPGFGKWLYCAKVEDPKEAARQLKEAGVETRPIFYPLPLCPAYEQAGDFPNAIRIHREHLCLPTGPHVTEEDREKIVHAIQQLHSLPLESTDVA